MIFAFIEDDPEHSSCCNGRWQNVCVYKVEETLESDIVFSVYETHPYFKKSQLAFDFFKIKYKEKCKFLIK